VGVVFISALVVGLLALIGWIVGPRPWSSGQSHQRLRPRVTPSDTSALLRDVDAYVAREMHAFRVPGAGLVIVHGADVLHERGFGVADPSGRPVTGQTPFILGSMSKAFTALAVMQLVDARQVDLDAPVRRYLPWFRVRDAAASARITVRQLLNQTSGLPKAEGMLLVQASRAVTDAEDARLIRRARLDHPPGQQFLYSNANYWLLGLIVESVSHTPFESYVRDRIFAPLDMRRSFTTEEEARQHGLATGYRVWFGFPRAEDLPYYARELSVAYLISSADDMGKFLIANLRDGRYRGDPVVSRASLALIHATSPGKPYAMGWLADSIGDAAILWHTGAVANYHCDMLLVPDRQLGIAILSNVNNILMEHQLSQTIMGIGALLLGYEPPSRRAPPYRFVYWIITLSAALWLVWRLWQTAMLWRLRRGRNSHGARDATAGRGRVPPPPIAWLVDPGLSIGIVFGVRVVLHTPFSTLRWFVPDLMTWLTVNVVISLALVGAAIRLERS